MAKAKKTKKPSKTTAKANAKTKVKATVKAVAKAKPTKVKRSGPTAVKKATALRSVGFIVGDQVRLLEKFMGVPAGSEGLVVAVDSATTSINVNIARDPQCNPAGGVLVGADMSIFDKNCHCDLG